MAVRARYTLYNALVARDKGDIYYIEVLGKALDVLDAFAHKASKRQLTLQDLSVDTRLNKNTVFRILYTLAEHDYIRKENQAYRIGPKLNELASLAYHREDLITVAGPYLDALREQFGETANLGVLDGGCVRYVDVRESSERLRLAERIGGSDPLHSTALGKAQLAFLPAEEVRRLMNEHGMPRITEHTISTISALKTELSRIRAAGYAVDREESMLGAFCIAAPILDGNQAPVAAVSIAGPNKRFTEEQLPAASAALRTAASEIQQKLGY